MLECISNVCYRYGQCIHNTWIYISVADFTTFAFKPIVWHTRQMISGAVSWNCRLWWQPTYRLSIFVLHYIPRFAEKFSKVSLHDEKRNLSYLPSNFYSCLYLLDAARIRPRNIFTISPKRDGFKVDRAWNSNALTGESVDWCPIHCPTPSVYNSIISIHNMHRTPRVTKRLIGIQYFWQSCALSNWINFRFRCGCTSVPVNWNFTIFCDI